MDEIFVDWELRKIYEDYYSPGLTAWREIAARDKAKHIIDLCHFIPHDSIVEIGAGDGAVLSRLDEVGFARCMYALEIADGAIAAIGRRNIRSLVGSVVFDGYRLPCSDKQFDLAVATHVIEHVEHPLIFLRELKRVAKYVFIEVPLEHNVQGIRDKNEAIRYGHVNFYDPFLVEILLERAGFEVIESRVGNSSLDIYRFQSGWAGFPKYVIKQSALKIVPFLACRTFSYVFFALCQDRPWLAER